MGRSPWHIAHSAMRDRDAFKGKTIDRGVVRRVWQFARPYRSKILLFLGTIAFLPYPTALLFAGNTRQPAAPVFYASCVAGAGLLELVVWLYAIRTKGLVPASVSPALRRAETAQILPVPVVFGLSIPVAFIAPGVAPFTWILLVPIGRIVHRIMRVKETDAAGDLPRRHGTRWLSRNAHRQ